MPKGLPSWPEVRWAVSLAPPESETAQEARDLCARVSPPYLFNHSARCYAWACALADVLEMGFDRELLYIASLLHDLGLTEQYEGPGCFEDEGAEAARAFASGQGSSEQRSGVLAETIRLHMASEVSSEDGAEAYLLAAATGCDVRGRHLEEIDEEVSWEVLARLPRLGFKEEFLTRWQAEAAHKPHCLVAAYLLVRPPDPGRPLCGLTPLSESAGRGKQAVRSGAVEREQFSRSTCRRALVGWES